MRILLDLIAKRTRLDGVVVVLLASAMAMTACSSGGGGGGGNGGGNNGGSSSSSSSSSGGSTSSSSSGGGSAVGDDARRAVLRDIGSDIIVPSLQDFATEVEVLDLAVDGLAAAPGDAEAQAAAQAAWRGAMTAWQRNEVLQVGPAGRSSNPDMVAGGQDFRDLIYSWPITLDLCGIATAAANGAAVDGNTAINLTGLGAIEFLLFTEAAPAGCAAQPSAAQRTAHLQKLSGRLQLLANSLLDRWRVEEGNFISQWGDAGLASSQFYMRPQDALNALSIALFYVEKVTKDRKIAYTTGIGASGLTCGNDASCPEYLESLFARHAGVNIEANFQVFKDVFTGVDNGLGLNDLLEGIDRGDLADDLMAQLDAVLAQLEAIENAEGFATAVENIPDRTECVNAYASSSGLAPCALLGLIKTATDTFRGPVVSALNLAIPSSAAGDND